MRKLPKDFQISVAATIIAASATLYVLSPQVKWEALPELLLFAALISLASMFPIPGPRGGYTTATPILFYVLFAVQGPGAGIMIASSAYAVGIAISRGWLPWKTLFNAAQIGISVALGGLVFRATGGSPVRPEIFSFLLPFVLAAMAHQLSNNFFVAVYFSRLRRLPLLSTWRSEMRDLLRGANILSVLSAALLCILYVSIHPAILLFFLVSLPLQRWASQLYLQQSAIHKQAIDSLVVAIDSNFPEGKGHSRRVAETAMVIGRQLNLLEAELETLEMSALLHDVGMIGLDDILPTTDNEDPTRSSRLQEHVRLGAEIARRIPRKGQEIAEIVLYHHENYDGSGYPLGLKEAEIPLGARIVRLAEAYESMLAVGSPHEMNPGAPQVVEIIKKQAGKMFDPTVVEAFTSAFRLGSIASAGDVVDTPPRKIIPESGAVS